MILMFLWKTFSNDIQDTLQACLVFIPQEIDFIGKTETLVDDLIYVFKSLDIKFDDNKIRNIPKINESYSTIEKPTWKGDIKEKNYYLEYPSLFRYGYLTKK